ncbi:Stk1 family PASTA domain-containing Ser/Thr kinase [Streptococcus gallolyticus subsp. gallolyticus]|jgi:serine/threonine protein kinase|uniref:Serine/threonine-protein kinase StkP n=3 Tax=Streptococcus gallolyticus TaxID=315405 RepID=A0A139QVG0_9STRE|nr:MULTISPECIES: Stk1 family PASTA domain-containing Ser/Thr kinase [Streptococcus]AQP41548.1 serine/threonine protein kinase [Streptococcus gallolyticus subsp. gallolyticus DSM 16831]KJF00297.1 serine/threonine protein kinase [Streptococcus gallolyticus subsp. gallolyticus]KXT66588.1 Serine/threonine protein kinase PrkC, regulator of stationary phase [Streptococcus gallolyticus]KXU06333.1 Serine/threonine protein kinase PrkC, regulator of stationary phase [Streptococcus gallolyticus]MCO717943
MIQIGKLFAGRYRILKSIGRGGMADVYLAKDLILDNEEVAIKVLRTNYQTDQIAVARFQREARAMAELNHPNIVSIRDIGEEDGQQFLVMEYVDGSDLKKYIQDHAPLSNNEVVRIMEEVLSAMTLAHQQGIVHRDLKPQNILLTKDGTVKVTDFGIAVAFAETSLTQTNSMLGSVHYLSPEQARGSKATVQSDIYAMGIMLFEMLTGHIPYDGDSAVTIALQHFQKPLPSIIDENKNVPQALENVVIKATAKRLSDRYASTFEMSRDLMTALSYNRSREPKLVFEDTENTKTLPKVTTSTSVPSTTEQLLKKQKAAKEDKAATENKATKAKTKKKKSRRMFGTLMKIFFAVVIVAIAIFTYLTLTSPSTVSVPDVAGSSLSEAKTTIKSSGLKVGTVHKVSSDTVESGYVIKTSPTAGSSKKEGSSIDIYVSKGSSGFKIKDYTGQDYQTAVKDLVNNYGVSESQIEIEEVSTSDYDEGVIISQTPSEGETFKVSGDDKITFKVAAESTVTMPNLTGYTYSEAIAALTALGVSSSHITVYQADPNSSTGYVQVSSPSSTATVTAQTPYYGETLSGNVVLYLAADEEESSQAPSSSSSESSESKESSSSSSSTDDSSSSTETSDE